MASDLEVLTSAVRTLNDSIVQMEGRLTTEIKNAEQRLMLQIAEVRADLKATESKLMSSNADNLASCINSVEAMTESVVAGIHSERVNRRNERNAFMLKTQSIEQRLSRANL